MIRITNSLRETRKLANDFAKKLIKTSLNDAVVVALEGELGAGKTTFVQGLAKALGAKIKIKSPTFNIVKEYDIPPLSNSESQIPTSDKLSTKRRLIHVDCYRLRDSKDLLPLGIKDMLKDKNNIILIEWAERVEDILPKDRVTIHIDHRDRDKRKISIYSPF